MNKNKHLLLSERVRIEQYLNNQMSFKGIGKELLKDPTTIAKEVKNHICFKSSGAYGRPFNDCINRNSCTSTNICGKLGCRDRICKFCATTSCTTCCIVYQKETCHHLSKSPYVCYTEEKTIPNFHVITLFILPPTEFFGIVFLEIKRILDHH